MGKVRLQDVARELGKSVKDVRELLKAYGIEKSNFSHLEEEELQIIYDNFGVEKEEEKQERVQETKKESKEQKQPKKESVKLEKPKAGFHEKKESKPIPKAPPPPPPEVREQKTEEKPKKETVVEKKISKEEQ
ncbi:MAG: translation initiation factor IF-2 N-terminal domain-containing protein, partial [Hydrogenobacter sp.]